MAENKKTIMFTDENNEQIAFEVLEQTTITGINYLLVCDAHDE